MNDYDFNPDDYATAQASQYEWREVSVYDETNDCHYWVDLEEHHCTGSEYWV